MISSLCAVIGYDEPFTPGENDLPMATEEGVKPHVMKDAVESIVEDDDAAFAGLSKKAKKMRPQQMKSQAALNHGFVADRNIIVADYAMCDVDVSENEGEVGEGESSTTPQRSKANRRCNVCGSGFSTRIKLLAHVMQKCHALHAEPNGGGA
jgi:hypothetical protein